jgi:iron complex transport system ATP-binding protein
VALEQECGLLLAMHDLEMARRYADRLMVMDAGRLAADGTAAAVLGSDEIPRIFGVERDDSGWNAVRVET